MVRTLGTEGNKEMFVERNLFNARARATLRAPVVHTYLTGTIQGQEFVIFSTTSFTKTSPVISVPFV